MGDVDHEHVHAGLEQFGGTLDVVAARADCGADAEAPLYVARGERLALLAKDVPRRHEPEQRAVRADERELLDLVRRHQRRRLFERRRATMGHQPLHRCHPETHGIA